MLWIKFIGKEAKMYSIQQLLEQIPALRQLSTDLLTQVATGQLDGLPKALAEQINQAWAEATHTQAETSMVFAASAPRVTNELDPIYNLV